MPFPLPQPMLDLAQQWTGVRFPLGFSARMLRDNGGSVIVNDEVWFLFPFADSPDRKRLARTAKHIEYETAKARDWPHFPPDAFAFAHNGAADLLIFRRDPSDPARLTSDVYLWRHDEENIQHVASDFDDLKTDCDDPEDL